MRFAHAMLGSIALAAAVAAPVSPASAHCSYRHCHRYDGGPIGAVFGLAGAIVVGAATIATAPLAVAGDILTGPAYGPAYGDEPEYRYSYRDDEFYRVRPYEPRYYRRHRPYRYAYGY